MYDYHMHTNASDDSTAPIDTMIERSLALGLEEIAITDHFDPDYPDPSFSEMLHLENYKKELTRVIAQYKDRIKILPGIEVGIRATSIEKWDRVLSEFPYDFVIGSVHSVEKYTIDEPAFTQLDSKFCTLDYYEYMYNTIKIHDNFDVIGHLNVIDRYVQEVQPANVYMDIVEAILRETIDRGKGIEINTSSFRYGMGELTTPTIDMLKLYIQMGGEIITTGSDAHRPEDIGDHLDFALKMIVEAGGKYVATYRNREPIFNLI
ncbi:MAG: histidinol-phosphatase HisJ family protein [Clostridiales Family XIII bacterium]|jgi:histidinol-phosphatase (PHP family)|nr:histidinol-phosphatase HisJ family protein [Clostridiales Family XIII bacterium]